MPRKVAIIGGGAAGFFTAVNLAEKDKNCHITLYEASNKVLAKVLVSGGGRCNVTNTISDPTELAKKYPRGHDSLKPVFQEFNTTHTQDWFTSRGVPLKTEDDGRVFPLSNTSQTIYNCLTNLAQKLGVTVKLSHRLKALKYSENKWQLVFNDVIVSADVVVLATGGNSQIYKILEHLTIPVVPPLPSLFTFNAEPHHLEALAGVSAPNVLTSIKEIKNSEESGPILVTHWGYSAPAILKLSAWHARELAALNYTFTLVINWNSYDLNQLRATFQNYQLNTPKDKVYSWRDHGLSKRLWQELVAKAELKEYTNWSEIGKKGIERLIQALAAFEVTITKKSTFKEEFVTAGGIDLDSIELSTFEVQNHQNLYAVGELLNIDAITGGFNFQAAWSGGFLAAQSMSSVK
jgi:predicted Rossmann fold flavoprotein